jgi:hypothetical protein
MLAVQIQAHCRPDFWAVYCVHCLHGGSNGTDTDYAQPYLDKGACSRA